MNRYLSIALLYVVFASSSAISIAQTQADLYVATDGKDSAAGTQTAPFRTIDAAVTHLHPGQTLYIREGIYAEEIVVRNSGTAAAPIAIRSYPGEHVAINGDGKLPLKKYDALIRLMGKYTSINGLEIGNSKETGVMLDGDHETANHLNVHHSQEAGVLARGDDTIVEYSTIWQNAHKNCRAKGCPTSPYAEENWATGLSAARNPRGGITHRAILRHNTAYQNWGEGISSYEAEGTVMEDNVAYDNWATNYYISDSSNVLFQRNIAYVSSGYTDVRDKKCIQLSDERADKPRSRHNIVINNMCMNATIDAFSWTGVEGSGLVDDLIANNTLIDGSFKIGSTTKPIVHSNTRVVNNLFYVGRQPVSIPSKSGVEYSNNLWSTKPPDVALGTASIVADPLLSAPAVIVAGKLDSTAFVPPAKSPAHGAGLALGPPVDADALGHARGSHPSIGAIEILP